MENVSHGELLVELFEKTVEEKLIHDVARIRELAEAQIRQLKYKHD